MSEQARSTIDQSEVDRFSAMAAEWWDPTGKFRPLHKINPVRLAYIRDKVSQNYGRDPKSHRPLEGLRILDIGCGGGLLSEPVARIGRPCPRRRRIGEEYRHRPDPCRPDRGGGRLPGPSRPRPLAVAGETFGRGLERWKWSSDVADVDFFISTCASMVRPGGLMLISTINRTFKAAALAIIGAEYVLGWLPRGTHQYEKLVRPEELEAPLSKSGMEVLERTGVFFNPLRNQWNLSPDIEVNYMMLAKRPAVTEPAS